MTELTREQVETMFGVAGGTRLSEWPFELQPETVQHILDTDAALRDKLEAVERERDEYESKYKSIALCGHDHSTQYWELRANESEQRARGFQDDKCVLSEDNIWLMQQLAVAQARIEKLEALSVIDRQANDEYREIRAANLAVIHTLTTRIEQLDAQRVVMEADNARLSTWLRKSEQFLEAQRTATYQAVEREHAAKKRLAQAEQGKP